MSFVLCEKYADKKEGLYLFYTNRLYRLLPVYYFFLVIKIFLSIVSVKFQWCQIQGWTLRYFIEYFDQLNPTTLLFLLFTNLMVFLQDMSLFLSIDFKTGMLYFTKSEWISQPSVWFFHFIPQAWTLSLEMCFYIIAPFLVRRRVYIIVFLLLLSFSARAYLYSQGLNYGWWTYSFFPTELALFLMGSVSYRIFKALRDKFDYNSKWPLGIWILIIIATLCYPLFPKTSTVPNFFSDGKIMFYLLIFLAMPYLFIYSYNSKIDRFVGELSYPIYLCHLIIIPFFGLPLEKGKSLFTILLIIGMSVALSLVTIVVIVRPIDRYRQKRIKNGSS